MKRLTYVLVAAICMMAAGCTKDAGAFKQFRLTDPTFTDADGAKVIFNYSTSKLNYEDDDPIYVNGVLFTLDDQGSQWVANSSTGDEVENVNNKFYVAYADNGSLTNFNSSTGSYTFNFGGKVNVQPANPTVPGDAHATSTNGILLAGASSDNLVHLHPACAIIRLGTNTAYNYVKVGFEANKVPYKGTVQAGTGSATITAVSNYLEGVTSELSGQFLYMIKCDDGWYVAVPIVGSSVTTTLFFEWYDGSATTKYKTQGQVTLQKGYVYSVGNSTQTPFLPNGFTKSRFQVNAGGTKVRFASGNLQYIPDQENLDPDTWEPGILWRLAPHQYDEIGSANSSISLGDGNDSYIDLFGWGTSGWSGSGATAYMPYSTSTTYGHYNTSNSIAATNADWGVYARSKGNIYYGSTVVTGSIRTLTNDEWTYLLNRSGMSGLATIGGMYKGLVLLPDIKAAGGAWSLPADCTFTAGTASGYTTNEYTFEQWDAMELQGAVFLPTTGYRSNTSVTNPSTEGFYWSTDYKNTGQCYALQIKAESVSTVGKSRAQGCAVRLVM